MSSIDRQRAALRVCFAATPSSSDLELLGHEERWLLYRTMVRARLRDLVEQALPRSIAAIGSATFGRLFDRWLAEAPPRARFFRDVASEFATFVLRVGIEVEDPARVHDLIAYERALWIVRDLPDEDAADVVPLAFDRVPVLCSAFHVVVLSSSFDAVVGYRENVAEAVSEECRHVLVYRRPDSDRVETLRLNPIAYEFVSRMTERNEPLAESVRAIAHARGIPIDPSYLEKVSAMLATFAERGVLRGSEA